MDTWSSARIVTTSQSSKIKKVYYRHLDNAILAYDNINLESAGQHKALQTGGGWGGEWKTDAEETKGGLTIIDEVDTRTVTEIDKLAVPPVRLNS